MTFRYFLFSAVSSILVFSCSRPEIEQVQAPEDDTYVQEMILKSMLENRDTRWTVDELSVPEEDNGWKIISTDKELAFLLEFGSVSGEKYRLMENIDFTSSLIADKLSSEVGVEKFEDFEFDGNGCVITGMNLPWAAGLFSRVHNAVIYNLTLSECTIGTGTNVSNLLGTGTVIGSASGQIRVSDVAVEACAVSAPCMVGGFVGSITDAECTFTRCDVEDTDVQTLFFKGVSGWCGGFVGFVGRSEEQNTSLSVSVKVDESVVIGGSVQAYMESDVRASGLFLGALNGFDANESFHMDGCTVSTTYTGLDNKASRHPNYFVGGHKYMNGIILIDGSEYAFPWDGVTKVQPTLVNGEYHVYTAEELAWFQGATVTDRLIIHKDIDMGGFVFEPIYKASYVDGCKADGTGSEIRNLKVDRKNCGKNDGGAFIRLASGTTVHKNLTFVNADIRATHDPAKTSADQAGGNAYCATLVSNISGTSYTMQNVHARNGRLYGVNKMGGLAGRVAATNSVISDCSVQDYYIENYEVDAPETFTALGGLVSATFYPQGEVGGLIGFIHCNAEVSRCHVHSTDINAYGQSDQYGGMVPGRHVGTVIGDVRTSSNSAAYTVSISETSSDDATFSLSGQHGKTLDKYAKANFIGKCYNVANDDFMGTVSVDGVKVL